MAELEPTSPTTATCANSLTRDQVANLADEIATDAHSIKRLALMLDASSDLRDRSAIATSIEALASRAGSVIFRRRPHQTSEVDCTVPVKEKN